MNNKPASKAMQVAETKGMQPITKLDRLQPQSYRNEYLNLNAEHPNHMILSIKLICSNLTGITPKPFAAQPH